MTVAKTNMSNIWLEQQSGKTGDEVSDSTSLRDENALLFAQLHVVQQELERRHHQSKVPQLGGVLRLAVDDSRFPEVAAECLRYRKALAAHDDVHLLQLRRSLANRLGTALIDGVSGPGAVFGLPGKLWGIWRDAKNYAPPASLGGKGFDKVVAAHKDGGDAAVSALLEAQPASVKAAALTALARTLADVDMEGAARCARQAFELDPRPFRLKWLAFREHEAGRAEEGEALLSALPSDMKFSESEQRQVGIVHADAERTRKREVSATYNYAARRRELEQKFQQLADEQAQQRASLEQQQRQLDDAQKSYADLERVRETLSSNLATQEAELNRVNKSRDVLQQAHDNLARDHGKLTREHADLSVGHADLVRLGETQARRSAEQEAQLIAQAAQIDAHEYARTQFEEERFDHLAQLEALRGEVQELSRADQEKGALLTRQQATIEEHELLRLQWDAARTSYVAQIDSLQRDVQALLQAQAGHAELVAQLQAVIQEHEKERTDQDAVQAGLAADVEGLQGRVQQLTSSHEAKSAEVEQQRRYIEDSDRLRQQWEQQCATLSERQKSLQKNVDALSQVRNEQADLLVRQVDLFGSILGQQHEVANGFINQLNASEPRQLERQLRAVVKEETANANRQMQAVIGLQSYYANGELPILNAERSTWPVSPDFALYLLQLIEQKHYDLIVEFGSGTSTVIIAKALAQQAARHRPERGGSTKLVSFDHLPSYFEETLAKLKSAGADGFADLRLAPLHAWTAPDGTPYPYYDCGAVLESLGSSFTDASSSILVIVDGPPASVGKLARYPAALVIKQYFPHASIDFVLDDFIREDEQQIARLWRADLESSGFNCQVTERRLEKGACLISASLKK